MTNLLQAIGNKELQRAYRNILKPFYGVLKTMDGCIKFALLTGVTEIWQGQCVQRFEQLGDISMWNEFIEICGVSDKEIQTILSRNFMNLLKNGGRTYDEIKSRTERVL